MNRKILLMILLSFAAHMAVAAVIVYLPSYTGTNEMPGNKERVIWGVVSGGGPIKGIRQATIRKDNIRTQQASASSRPDRLNIEPEALKEIENNPLLSPFVTGGTDIFPPVEKGGKAGEESPLPFNGGDGAGMGILSDGSFSDSATGTCPAASQCGNMEGPVSIVAGTGFDRHKIMEFVRKEIERHKYYPHIAKLRGIEGTVFVSFYIGQDGIPASITVARSSGSGILDQAGVQTISRIGKISEVQKELRDFDIVVPITYKLE